MGDVVHGRRNAGVLVILIGVALWFAMAQAAQAGTLSRDSNGVVTFTAAAGEANNMDVFQSGTYYYVFDRTQNMTDAGSGCQDFSAYGPYWFCGSSADGTAPTAFKLILGDGNDTVLPQQYCCSAIDRPVTIDGGPGNDALTGSGANDVIDGGLGADTINGGGGVNRADYIGRPASDDLTITLDGVANDGGSGPTSTSDGSADNLVNIQQVTGGDGDDMIDAAAVGTGVRLQGGPGDDILIGGGGNDSFLGDPGADAIIGGGGTDTMSYAARAAGVTAVIDGGFVSGNSSDGAPSHRDAIFASVENLVGSSSDDTLIGDSDENVIDGGDGNDTVEGGLGDDTLAGDAGFDVLGYSYRTAAQPIIVDLSLTSVTSSNETDAIGSTFEGVTGGAGSDVLTGTGAANRIDGGPGVDAINGLGGIDTLLGGVADDHIDSRDDGPDSIDCGDGNDTNEADPVDSRSNCELPAPAAASSGGDSGSSSASGSGAGAGAGSGSTGPAPGPPPPAAAALTQAQIDGMIAQQLVPPKKLARIAALLKARGLTQAFRVPVGGKLVVQWFYVPPRARLAKAKPVLIASGQKLFSAAGSATLKINLSAAGKKMLKRRKALKLTARGLFTPVGRSIVRPTRSFAVRP